MQVARKISGGGQYSRETARKIMTASKKGQKVWLKASPNYLQLHIQILDIEPPIWRRIIIEEDCSFGDLHRVLQRIMPWHNSHTHNFVVNDPNTGEDVYVGPAGGLADPDFPIFPENNSQLIRYLRDVGHTCVYTYDMGNSWDHLIKVEQIFDHNPNPGGAMVRCIDGARAPPPEDSGGTPGYEDLLQVLADPNHAEHEEMIEWLESQDYPNWDPEHFDLNEANVGLP